MLIERLESRLCLSADGFAPVGVPTAPALPPTTLEFPQYNDATFITPLALTTPTQSDYLQYTMVSNIMKTKPDTIPNTMSNVR